VDFLSLLKGLPWHIAMATGWELEQVMGLNPCIGITFMQPLTPGCHKNAKKQ